MASSFLFEQQPRPVRQGRTDDSFLHSYPSRTFVHASLEVSKADDPEEAEADSVAATVAGGGRIRRSISQSGSGSGINVSGRMERQLFSQLGGGSRMPEGLRSRMEAGFGMDFSDVRIHTDAPSVGMNRSIRSKAFTYGRDIFFNQGQFSPESRQGQALVAHELTHVVQGGSRISRQPDDERRAPVMSPRLKGFLCDTLNELQEFLTNDFMPIINYISRYYDDRAELDYIGGSGIAASKSELDSWKRHSKIQAIRGSIDNIRNGLIAGGISDIAINFGGVSDPEVLYNLTQIGATFDTMISNLYGETRYHGPQKPASHKSANVRPAEKSRAEQQREAVQTAARKAAKLKEMKAMAEAELAGQKNAYDVLLKQTRERTDNIPDYSAFDTVKALESVKTMYNQMVSIMVAEGLPDKNAFHNAFDHIALIEMRINIINKQHEIDAM